MTELSPAAQEVLTAAICNGPELEYRIAAAFRAVDEELASCLFVGPDEGDIKRVIDVSDLHNLIDELEAQ
jgi:hypothetical protein